MFSFGIVLWELLTGEEPYADLHYGVIIGGYNPALQIYKMQYVCSVTFMN